LKRRGGVFTTEPFTVRPGLKIAFIRGPENSRIEILERS
jgi:lactoylglutathione lyase